MPRPLIGITTHRRDSDEGKKDLFALMAAYVDSVRNNGGLPVLVPLGLSEPELRDLFERLDGFVLSGGGDIDPDLLGTPMHATVYGIDGDRAHCELIGALIGPAWHRTGLQTGRCLGASGGGPF